jgi:hypothetical protein
MSSCFSICRVTVLTQFSEHLSNSLTSDTRSEKMLSKGEYHRRGSWWWLIPISCGCEIRILHVYCGFDDDIAFQFFPLKGEDENRLHVALQHCCTTQLGFLAKTHFPKLRVIVEISRSKSVCVERVLVIVYMQQAFYF